MFNEHTQHNLLMEPMVSNEPEPAIVINN
jgi:hypothetical protein